MKRWTDEYFEWLFDMVHDGRFARGISYEKLLRHLHDRMFKYIMKRDSNRASDGVDLRYRFSHEFGEMYYYKPCSILEMMIALAIRCEESIMDDPLIGDRTGQWFWDMIVSLGLGSMTDDLYSEQYVDDVLERFVDREYEPNGKGGLFTVYNHEDMREVEIWGQMLRYLNTFV